MKVEFENNWIGEKEKNKVRTIKSFEGTEKEFKMLLNLGYVISEKVEDTK